MPIITFISDFGTTDHYVASVKGSILKYNPELYEELEQKIFELINAD